MLKRITTVLLLAATINGPVFAAGDSPVVEDYTATFTHKVHLRLTGDRTIDGYSAARPFDKDKAIKCGEFMIDPKSIYRSAYTYEDMPLKELVSKYPEDVEFFKQFLFVNEDEKILFDRNDVVECSSRIYHQSMNLWPDYSGVLKLNKADFDLIKNQKPYGYAIITSSGPYKLILISYNKKYYDDPTIEGQPSVYEDVYQAAYGQVYDEFKKTHEGSDSDLSELDIQSATIKKLKNMRSEGIICIEVYFDPEV